MKADEKLKVTGIAPSPGAAAITAASEEKNAPSILPPVPLAPARQTGALEEVRERDTDKINREDVNTASEKNRRFAPHAKQNWALEDDTWLKEKIHWTDSKWGQVGIEFASRITVGALFYSWMNNSNALAALKNYTPENFKARGQSGEQRSWLEHVAYFFDMTLGRGIKSGMMALGASEERADKFLTFRENRLQGNTGQHGRSYGAEITDVSADFAAMSIGTNVGRIGFRTIFNPTERKAWLKDGKFDLLHLGKQIGVKVWETLTLKQGEDWAVGPLYVIYMRWQRNVLNYVFPGFKHASDRVDNGGGMVLGNDGKVRGHYLWAGFWDIQGRFTAYNVLTQLYRDAYSRVGQRLIAWKEDNFALRTPEWLKDPATLPERAFVSAKGTLRYLVISSIRSILQMTPTVPFFSIFRVPAARKHGIFVHPDYGVLEGLHQDGNGGTFWAPIRMSQEARDANGNLPPDSIYNAVANLQYSGNDRNIRFSSDGTPEDFIFTLDDGSKIYPDNPAADRIRSGPADADPTYIRFDPYGYSGKGRPLRHDAINRAAEHWGAGIHQVANHSIWEKASGWFWRSLGYEGEEVSKRARGMALAGMPYAFYFSAKVYNRHGEQMNLAIGRALDGAISLNWKEFREGLNEITKTMNDLPLSNPARQAALVENHRHNPTDKSPIPADWTPELHREYLNKVKEGKTVDAAELAYIISERRSDYYRDKAQKVRSYSGNHLSKEELQKFIRDREQEGIANPDNIAKLRASYREAPPPAPAAVKILGKGERENWQEPSKKELALLEVDSPSPYLN